MSEDIEYSNVCVQMCEAETNVELWWIDDCFTHEGSTGDKIPYRQIEAHGRNYLDRVGNVAEVNHNVAQILIESCQNRANLFFCSFEYAEENFKRINGRGNGVLLDVQHIGKGEFYGFDMYRRKIAERIGEPDAVFSFLTSYPRRIVDADDWLPQVPFPINKTPDQSALASRIDAFIDHVRETAPRRSSVLDAANWAEMRTVALRTSEEKRPEGPLFVHHVPCGGANEGSQTYRDLHDAVFKRVAEKFPFTYRFPEYCWSQKMSDIEIWDQPPQRSLIQFDKYGRDLSSIFHFLSSDLSALADVKSGIHVPNMEVDYLWFNAPALARSLFKLANSFSDKIERITSSPSDDADEPDDTETQRVVGTFSVAVREWKNENHFQGLAVEVYLGKHIQGFDDTIHTHKPPQFDTVSFPMKEESKTVSESHAVLEEKCGADVQVNDNCLQIRIPSRRMENEDFELYVVDAQ